MIFTLAKILKHWRLYKVFAKPLGYGAFKGVFSSFTEARKAIPKHAKQGYNHEKLANDYVRNLTLDLAQYDYPVLFWLNKILTPSDTVFDIGGNVGTHYFKYEPHTIIKTIKSYTVADLPHIIEAGQKLNQYSNLHFTSDINNAINADVLFTSGTLQYIENFNLSSFIKQSAKLPAHLLINRLPLHPSKSFVTLQNGGLTYYPQYVFIYDLFIEELEKIGYIKVDEWIDYVDKVIIPFKPVHNKVIYKGFYFKLA